MKYACLELYIRQIIRIIIFKKNILIRILREGQERKSFFGAFFLAQKRL